MGEAQLKIKVEQFEGPLELLLQLIENQKLEITKVALADVTEQYIKILNQTHGENIRAEYLADFLVIAARLLLIKSKALLPFLQWEDEEDGDELARQLKIYKEYLDASKVIAAMVAKKRYAFSRQRLLMSDDLGFSPPPGIDATAMRETFENIIRSLSVVVNLPSQTIERTIHIQEKIEDIRNRIANSATARFSEILKEAKDKTEVIVSFLALLELVKAKTVFLKQEKTFDDIIIERI